MYKKLQLFSLMIFFSFFGKIVSAQTFTGTGGSIITLTDTSRFNINVSGLSPSSIDFTYGLESVTINITHNQDKDIDCFLAAPDGTLIELTTDNGNTGHNFTNTVFRHDASTAITSGSAPFTGSYRPEGSLWRVNNGQNGNGTWQLRVIDDSNNLITGSVTGWSIKFSNIPAQTFIFSQSSLPIVIINTNGQTIPDDPKIIADMQIIDNGTGVRNHLTDVPNNYNGKIAIEIRGSSSQMFPKKSWGFETRDASGVNKNDVSLLGMPVEHDWILSANYTDKSFCRNVLSYQLSNEMGHYAVRTKYVDVVLNGTYQGIYVFMESIKRDHDRVDISKLLRTETTAPDVTGGYILKVDKTTGSGGGGWTSPYAPINHANGQSIYLQYDYPSTDSIVPSQEAYVQAYVDSFEDALAGPNFRDSIVGYPKYISNGSWIDYFFSNEISKNVDGYRISSYLHKDKSKQLKAGPVWDYDIAFGNANYCSGSDTTGWAYLFSCTGDSWQIPFWWQKLLQDTNYTNQMKCRWNAYRQSALSLSHVNGVIDSIASVLNESQAWNFNTWPILGTYVWPNPSPQPSTYAGEIQNLKNWMSTRLAWLDANMPGHCACSVSVATQPITCAGACDGQLVALGNSPYSKTFLWDNGNTTDTIATLCDGSYSVSLTDRIGCTATTSVTLVNPAVLTANAIGTNAPCNSNGCQGSASANASGGTAPYSYLWSDGQTTAAANGLCSGTYSVVITDAHNCTTTASVDIVNPMSPVVAVSAVTDATCYNALNGGAAINVSGGTGPYTYSWMPSGGNTSVASNLAAGNYTVTVTDATGCPASASMTVGQPSAINIGLTPTDTRCFGSTTGSVSLSVSGGQGFYNYVWTPGGFTTSSLASVVADAYTVVVTDAIGCTSSATAVVNDPPVISGSINATAVLCHDGSDGTASVLASGGTGSLSYLWSPGGMTTSSVNNLSAGNYSVTITDANNCAISYNANVANASAMTLSFSSTPSSCSSPNGSASVTASGGSAPYLYLWQQTGETTTTIQNLNSGVYFVTVTDANECVKTDSVFVDNSSGMTASVQSQQNVSCFGGANGSANLSATGGVSPYTYQWSPSGGSSSSATGLTAGNYFITIHDATGCTSVQQVTITEPSALNASVANTAANCFGQSNGRASASVSGGVAPYTYLWSPSGGTDSVASNLLAGNYSVRVTDSNGCSTSASTTITQPTAMNVVGQIQNSTCGYSNGRAIVIATGGTQSYSYAWTPAVSLSDTAFALAAGNYSVVVTDQNGCTSMKVLSVQTTTLPVLSVTTNSPASCNGANDGSLQLNVANGSGNFTYEWTPSVSSSNSAATLSAGLYSIVVSDLYGCSDSIGVFVQEPSPLGALIYSYGLSCAGANDGSMFADVGGGTMPYTFLWTPGNQTGDTAVNLAPGNYSVLLTDAHGCTSVASGNVTSPDPISVSGATNGHTCFNECNGQAFVQASGGSAPYNYLWTNGAMTDTVYNACSGLNTVQVTDALGCQSSMNFTVTEDDSMHIEITHTNATCQTCTNGSAMAQVSGGHSPFTYFWTPGNFSGAAISGLLPGVYTLCVTDSNQCQKCDTVEIQDLSIGVEELSKNTSLYVFPNPAADYTIFAFGLKAAQEVNLSLFTSSGSLITQITNGQMEAGEHFIRLETSDLAPGVYYFRFTNNDSSRTGTLVVTR